jgi:hypothetical protein
MTKTFSKTLQCPKCFSFLYVSGQSRHETLSEHVINPNGTPSLKPEYRCPNKCYPKCVFWDYDGDAYIGTTWLQRFLWGIGIHSVYKDIETRGALHFHDGKSHIQNNDGTHSPIEKTQ